MTVQDELTGYLSEIENFNKDLSQDATELHVWLITLTQYMARANGVMAEYHKKFREEKARAYKNLIASSIAQEKYFSATQGKDYVDAMCSETGYVYDLAERLSRTCVHTIDAIRTVISSLKSERQFASYGG